MYVGACCPLLSPEGCREGENGVLGQPRQFCVMFASSSWQHGSRQLLFLFNSCVFASSFLLTAFLHALQLSCYNPGSRSNEASTGEDKRS
jgi:hypothetical protein